MRKALLLLLLSSAAPGFAATAQRSDSEERSARIEARAERAERAEREERSERRERPARVEREQREEREPRQERRARNEDSPRGPFGIGDVMRGARNPEADGDSPARRGQDGVRRPGRGTGAPTLVQEGETAVPERMRDWRQRQLEAVREGRPLDGRTPPVISRVPREGTQPPPPVRHVRGTTSRHNWRGDWRNDRRYNWRDYRTRNRSRFHLGIYIDPFGWRHRPYSVGWRMWPGHYRSSYWLNDPWSYRLPYAPAGYRWIRYYDDAVLVDTWSGEVVDVIRNFFW